MSLSAAPPRLRWAAVVAWMGAIFWLSSRSTLPRPPGASPSLVSVLGHLGAYAVLALLLAWALLATGRRLPGTFALAWVLAVLYGVTDEIHQSFVPNRHPDLFDVLTDATGAAVALAAVWWLAGQAGPRRAATSRAPS